MSTYRELDPMPSIEHFQRQEKTYSQGKHTKSFLFKHGTLIRTGIICKKIPCYMRDSACR